MIPRSPAVAAGALMLATFAHASLIFVQAAQPEVRIEGGAREATASLGSAFADLAAGTSTPVSGATRADTPEPDTTPDVPPDEVAEPAATETARAVSAEATAPTAHPAASVPVQIARQVAVPTARTTTSPSPVDHQSAPIQVAMLRPAPIPPEAAEPPAQAPMPPEPAEATPAATPQKTAPAVDDETPPSASAPMASQRPIKRPEKTVEHKTEPPPANRKRAQTAPALIAGNADRTAKKGTATGKAEAKSATSGRSAASSKTQGNAAASNYPGKVFARIARAQRQAVSAKGVAIVAFSISGNGALASAAIARSSGNGALDQAAVKQVRRAAPFPPPPPGARQSFTVRITGR